MARSTTLGAKGGVGDASGLGVLPRTEDPKEDFFLNS